ncbi:MAG: phosphate acyltransferase PlsX [Dehalococcoidia bacterium]|nr:Phosphate acyltransferase [Chloroflexota bacterium]MBT9159317.1 Phosphate acyltransferase [Chloroflexota bacterium]MBT9161808.1 Phosphate acyltransferase [Chloroflexota bacterium]
MSRHPGQGSPALIAANNHENGQTEMIRVVVDAMGGDYAPREIVRGAVEAARQPNIEVILVGQREAVEKELSGCDLDGARISTCWAEETVSMDEDPVRAIRRKPNSSIAVGIKLVKSSHSSAFVSGGSTGAVAAAALLILGKKKGISRPALGIVFTSPSGPVLFLDVGANPDCRPQHLVQFAEMGNVYMKRIFSISEPRIGLLSNGEEETKGDKLTRATYQLLAKGGLNFLGNVEGHDLPRGKADVVVTDGFTGNVVIKLSEGLGEVFAELSKQAVDNNPIFREAEKRILNYTALGGAFLLGVKGNVIITHGRSDAAAIKQAVRIAEQMVRQRVTEAIGH